VADSMTDRERNNLLLRLLTRIDRMEQQVCDGDIRTAREVVEQLTDELPDEVGWLRDTIAALRGEEARQKVADAVGEALRVLDGEVPRWDRC